MKKFFLFLVFIFSSLIFSCDLVNDSSSNSTNFDNLKFSATNEIKAKELIRKVIDAFDRGDDFDLSTANLCSFEIVGESRIPKESSDPSDYSNLEFESSILVKFDGENKFYREDEYEGVVSRSYEEYSKLDNGNSWVNISMDISGEYGRQEFTESQIYSLFTDLSEALTRYENVEIASDNSHQITLTSSDETVKVICGFDENHLIFLDIINYSNTSSKSINYEHRFIFRKYGSDIKIDIPEAQTNYYVINIE